MTASLPVPTLDHVVVNVRDDMDAAAAIWRRLGFTLTPRGHHTLGSINHLAMFGTDYLELLGVPAEGGQRTDVLDWPAGLNGIVFGCNEADTLYRALAGAGAPVLPPLAFSRPVDLPGGARDAAFRVVRVDKPAVASGRVFFCHHLTRDVVWRDEWRRHANGVVGVAGVVVQADAPDRLGGLFRALFGADAVVAVAGGLRLVAGLAQVDVVTRAEVERRFGAAAPAPDGRGEAMAGLVLRTVAPDRTALALRHGGIEGVLEDAFSLRVPAASAGGVAIEFRAG